MFSFGILHYLFLKKTIKATGNLINIFFIILFMLFSFLVPLILCLQYILNLEKTFNTNDEVKERLSQQKTIIIVSMVLLSLLTFADYNSVSNDLMYGVSFIISSIISLSIYLLNRKSFSKFINIEKGNKNLSNYLKYILVQHYLKNKDVKKMINSLIHKFKQNLTSSSLSKSEIETLTKEYNVNVQSLLRLNHNLQSDLSEREYKNEFKKELLKNNNSLSYLF